MKTILAVSPHLDDAVFSAGGALAHAAQSGTRVILATVFTGSVAAPQGFALACQLDKGLAPDADYMALRRAEDRKACAIIRAEPWHCGLLEAPHRGYASATALFGPLLPGDDGGGISTVLAHIIGRADPDTIWAPRAIGGHVDHILLHRAIRALPVRTPVVWWTDWPYAGKADAMDTETAKLTEIDCLDMPQSLALRQRKADACAAYATQLGFQFGGEAKLRALLAQQQHETYAFRATQKPQVHAA